MLTRTEQCVTKWDTQIRMFSQLGKWMCPAICNLMDQETVRTYDSDARGFAEEWEEEQTVLADLLAAVR